MHTMKKKKNKDNINNNKSDITAENNYNINNKRINNTNNISKDNINEKEIKGENINK